jgi:hypothetical protein
MGGGDEWDGGGAGAKRIMPFTSAGRRRGPGKGGWGDVAEGANETQLHLHLSLILDQDALLSLRDRRSAGFRNLVEWG